VVTLVTTVDELVTVLRVPAGTGSTGPAAEWIRDGEPRTAARSG
jgi:hypothetical protein